VAHDPLPVDLYSAYDYKPAFRDLQVGPAPTWVDKHNERRLRAYTLLASYLENSARSYLVNDKDPDGRREYGDPSLIVDNLVDAVLGEGARIMVDNASLSDDNENQDDYADTVQEFFDRWVEADNFHMTAMEVESDSVGLGDGVYVVSWDSNRGRATVTCYDPGFYFPVLDPSSYDDQYPSKVHIAWEYETFDNRLRNPQRFIRRITYEVVDLADVPDGVDTTPRAYPWRSRPSTKVCLKSDGVWSYEGVGSRDLLDLNDAKAVWQVNSDNQTVYKLDIGVDFVPVVHLPNTISRKEHFGRSALQKILQIIDDLQSADTDLLKTSRTTGSPPLGSKSPVTTNEEGEVQTYGPGQIIEGEITVIDTSKNLDALTEYIDFLLKRLSTNVRMPESVLGKLRPSEVPSGIALALSFGPLRSLVRRMRLVRQEKYPLLLQFVHRFSMLDEAHADLRPPRERIDDIPIIRYAFGQFLPSDTTVILTDITSLFREKIISRNTAIRLLIEEAGMNIREAQDEVDQIENEDFEGARVLGEALESPEAAAEYLGREIPPMSEARQATFQMEQEAAVAQAEARGFGGGGNNQNGNRDNQGQGAGT
jgi:hypothetical protein